MRYFHEFERGSVSPLDKLRAAEVVGEGYYALAQFHHCLGYANAIACTMYYRLQRAYKLMSDPLVCSSSPLTPVFTHSVLISSSPAARCTHG